MPAGKYFFILSKQNGRVLEVSLDWGESSRVWLKETFNSGAGAAHHWHQLWYKDHGVGTIRSQMHDLCLDINGDDEVVVSPYQPGRDEQQWMTAHDVIVNSVDVNKVLAVQGNSVPVTDMGVHVAKPIEGDLDQLWHYHHVPATYFYIRSELNGNVVEVRPRLRGDSWLGRFVRRLKSSTSMSAVGGGPLVLRLAVKCADRKGSQLWYEDRDSVLHSQQDDLVVDVSSKRASMTDLQSAQTIPPGCTAPRQLASINKERISSRTDPGRVLSVKGYEGEAGAKIYMGPYNGRSSQHWVFEHEHFAEASNCSLDGSDDDDDASSDYNTSQAKTECETCR